MKYQPKLKDLSDRTIVYALGIYINSGMRYLLIEYLKRASKKYKAVHVMFCYWWPGVEAEPFVKMVNDLNIDNLRAWEFSIMASPAFGRKMGWAGASWYKSLTSTFDEIRIMKNFLVKIDADLIHIILTEYQASFAFARAAGQAGVDCRLLSFTGVSPVPAQFRKLINRITDKYLTGVLLASEADKDGAIDQFPTTKKSIVHGWGLAPDLFNMQTANPGKFRAEIGIDDNTPLIGTTTRIAPNKGQETLINAMPELLKKFPNLKCVILGGRYDKDQPETDRLKTVARHNRCADSVLFLGERDDAPDIFAAYDVAVHLADFDYLPFGVLECMALGKPCVCTNVGGIPELITHGDNGLLVHPGNYEDAAVAISFYLENPGEMDRTARRAREFVLNRYDLDKLVDRVERMYADAMMHQLKEMYS
jgi:glycosyltransferase involved in cell wall biosynthesis